jgi:hypothetical protein
MRANTKLVRCATAVAIGLCGESAWSGIASAQAPSRWEKTPTVEDVAAAYPAKAQQAGVEGRAVLVCAAMPSGVMEKCAVESEEPAGSGFGAAVLSLSPKFVLKRDQVTQQPVKVALRFVLPELPERQLAWVGKPGASGHLGPPGPYFPDNAYRRQVGGEVWIKCMVGPSDELDACEALEVSPGGFGFEYAAVKMAERRYIKAAPAAQPSVGPFVFRVLFPKPKRGP